MNLSKQQKEALVSCVGAIKAKKRVSKRPFYGHGGTLRSLIKLGLMDEGPHGEGHLTEEGLDLANQIWDAEFDKSIGGENLARNKLKNIGGQFLNSWKGIKLMDRDQKHWEMWFVPNSGTYYLIEYDKQGWNVWSPLHKGLEIDKTLEKIE